MRGRDIHKLAHWSMMFLLLMFPLLMVGISTFGKESQTIDVQESYEYETNEVNSVDDLVVGNIYKATVNLNDISINQVLVRSTFISGLDNDRDIAVTRFKSPTIMNLNFDAPNLRYIIYESGNYELLFYEVTKEIKTFYFVFETINGLYSGVTISASDYLGEKTVTYEIHNEDYKQDVNNWVNAFIDLPVNAWYKSLMNVIGVGFTTSTVMNVIYVMPVYIIWVFVLDLIVDCLLVIVRIPHKALNRLGGDNE